MKFFKILLVFLWLKVKEFWWMPPAAAIAAAIIIFLIIYFDMQIPKWICWGAILNVFWIPIIIDNWRKAKKIVEESDE